MKNFSAVRFLAGIAIAIGSCRAGVVIDASKPAPSPQPLPFAAGGRSPDGHTLAVNNRYMLLDGKPWFPVMGEFQYSRYPAADWEREILKMKAGGIRIVSTYIFWIHHEEQENQFDWTGRRNLRQFTELAGKHGMYVWARVGPWDHGEVRNGGLPDWVLAKSKPRSNDPAYLKYVQRFYGEIGKQLAGLFFKNGGPVIGVQIENEYHSRGEGMGEEHILTLHKMARSAGLDAPFYTVTGWDDAAMPTRDVLPVFGGYPDGFWYRQMTPLPPSPTYFFSAIRCDENVDDELCSRRPDIDKWQADYPFFTAEMGGGMELSYHRRPILSADDIASISMVKLGSGVTLYGYYMFHGGTNPDGKLTTLQESQATGYPNDLPLKAYDFQAPLGEFGQMHPSFRDLKSLHLFLDDFGPGLAPMASYLPGKMPRDKQDTDTPRAAVRSDGAGGYLFLSTYQKDHPLPAQKAFQAEVKLAGGTLLVPRKPVDIPSGAYTAWPLNLTLGGVMLEYATAQPLCRLDDPDTAVFFAWPGIEPEFAFRESADATIDAAHAHVERAGGRIYISGIAPGLDAAIRIRGKNGRTAQILLVSREQARNLWKAPLGGRDRLVYSPADLYFDGDRVHMASIDPRNLTLAIFPKPAGDLPGLKHVGTNGIFDGFAASVEPIRPEVALEQIAEAGKVPAVKMGLEVATAPPEEYFEKAARWLVRVANLPASGGEILLRLTYQGDVARLYAGDHLITDDFYHGTPWEIGLRNIPPDDLKRGLELKILPLRQDAPIYLAAGARPDLPAGGQVAKVTEARLIAEYCAETAVH